MEYPITFNTQQPTFFQRGHILIRLVILLIFFLSTLIPWIFSIIFLLIPVTAAIFISQKGADKFLSESDRNLTLWLKYLLGFYTYMGLLTDRFPTRDVDKVFDLNVKPEGKPTVATALLKIIFVIPHLIVLFLLSIPCIVLYPLAIIFTLITQNYPEVIYGYFRGWLRWSTRVHFYLGSIVEEYPPFSFNLGDEHAEKPTTIGDEKMESKEGQNKSHLTSK